MRYNGLILSFLSSCVGSNCQIVSLEFLFNELKSPVVKKIIITTITRLMLRGVNLAKEKSSAHCSIAHRLRQKVWIDTSNTWDKAHACLHVKMVQFKSKAEICSGNELLNMSVYSQWSQWLSMRLGWKVRCNMNLSRENNSILGEEHRF